MRLAWLAALAFGSARAAVDIDKGGFLADGSTTYCQQVSSEKDVNEFLTLNTSSIGHCPVTIDMVVTVKSYTMTSTIVDVTWSVTVTADRTNVWFPVQLDTNGKITVSPLLRACPVGSNCANKAQIIEATQNGSKYGGTLDPVAGSKLELSSYTFQFPSSGDYTIVGDVNTVGAFGSLVDNVVFQRFRATVDGSTAPGTIKPVEDRLGTGFGLTTSPGTTPDSSTDRVVPDLPNSTPHLSVEAQEATGAGISTKPSKGGTMNALVMASIGAVGVVIAAMFFVSARNKQKNEAQPVDPTDSLDIGSIYRLTDMAQDVQSMRMPTRRQEEGNGSIVSEKSVVTGSDRSGSGFPSFSTIRDDSTIRNFEVFEESNASYRIPVGALRTTEVGDGPMTLTEMMPTYGRKDTMRLSELLATAERQGTKEPGQRGSDARSSEGDTVWF